MNRQCSIDYPEECSDPNGYDCTCNCHEAVSMAQHAAGSMTSTLIAVLVIGEDGEPIVAMTPEASIATIRKALETALKDLAEQEAEEAQEKDAQETNQRRANTADAVTVLGLNLP